MKLWSYFKGLGRALVGAQEAAENRSYWNPECPLSDPCDWQTERGGTDSGVSVNEFTALQHGPVWRAVNLISGDVARIPLLLYRRKGENGRERYTNDPVFRLLRRRPNRSMTAFLWKKLLTADVLLWGNAYAFIVRDGNGRPSRLLRLDPYNVCPKRDQVSGELWYEVRLEGIDPFSVDASEMLHLRGIGTNEKGYSVVQMAREGISLGVATRTHGAKYFKQGSRPTMIVEVPDSIGPDGVKLIQDQFPKKYGGLDKQHIPVVLDQGAKGTVFTTSNEDAQFLGSREFDLVEVSHWFNIPPGKLGHTARSSYASVEQENLSYLDSLDPHFVMWEQECDEKLISLEQKRGDTAFTEFLREALVRVDIKTQWEVYRQALSMGAMNLNEVRARGNLEALPGEVGEVHMVPANMMNAEELLEPEEPEPQNQAPAVFANNTQNPPDPDSQEGQNGNQSATEGAQEGGESRSSYEAGAVLDLVKRSFKRIEHAAKRKIKNKDGWARFLGVGLEKHRGAIQGLAAPILALEELPDPASFAKEITARALGALYEVRELREIPGALEAAASQYAIEIFKENKTCSSA